MNLTFGKIAGKNQIPRRKYKMKGSLNCSEVAKNKLNV